MRGKITALVAAVAAAAGTASAVKWARGRKEEEELDLEVGGTSPPVSEAPASSTVPAAPPVSEAPASSTVPAAPPPVVPNSVDDLTAIKGLGKVRASKLVAAGVTSYAQIAAWTDDDIAEMGLACDTSPGQIKRADWVGQAKVLAEV